MPKVAIFMGSKSDLEKVKPCAQILEMLEIDYKMTITSAHRTPERTYNLIKEMEEKGCQVFICAAGMAAHLAGVVASKTVKPVIGIPISASSLGGMDALLSTVQMPPGFPVGTVALDKAGAKNAAWFAAQILALTDASLAQKIANFREEMKKEVEKAANEL
ncbi:5-(carboxyamino)imidazole ribonucleotide mutase [Desulfonauticus submarinus]|uniref:N5-carboxyaminoimidazole ribonucleotide mutase n=1 Tax=Desulfonauticus submarinus TaxID=206665 RepID=A0A1G9ZJ21_9BACT|nr:5-(carboxyamino)imidazole ribonucleotide mutase [Desulfonauticus submarinus]SDN20503.1 5-(carboxyamino)imidazole ribonucleotide mutase [Desulfonauticus submarinus]